MDHPAKFPIGKLAMDRRAFLIASASLLGTACWPGLQLGAVEKKPQFSENPFKLGVASGDPASDSVVLWTRLMIQTSGKDNLAGANISVTWRVAEDEGMSKIVSEGTSVASPELAHSVHAEVAGLSADRWYWYQFQVGQEFSPKGRTRTLPASSSLPTSLKFSLASCQNFESGFYTAYDHMLKENCDLVIFVGDYIYENAIKKGFGPRKVPAQPPCDSLENYRLRHALYKSDPQLQAMHAAAPWIVTPDDHEVVNDYANDLPPENQPKVSREDFLRRRAAAYQAYYEHLPLRLDALPKGPNMQLYRKFSFGRLAEFFVLDTRQYRTNQPDEKGGKQNDSMRLDPNGTILGIQQRDWLLQGLAKSTATWNVLAQQIMFARLNFGQGAKTTYSLDSWGGYEHERQLLVNFLRDKKIANPVILSGDYHANWVSDIPEDFDKPDSRIIASEFLGTSISSFGNGEQMPKKAKEILSKNPVVKFHNAERGYVVYTVDKKSWRADFRTLPYITKPGAPLQTRASFVIEAGSPGTKPAG